MVKRLSTMRETRVQSLGGEDLLEKEMATHSNLPGKSHGQRSLEGYLPEISNESRHNSETKNKQKQQLYNLVNKIY